MIALTQVAWRLLADVLWLAVQALRPRGALAAENLFLRRQLGMYVERGARPRRTNAAVRLSLVALSKLFAWRSALVLVRPQTLVRWHRTGFRLLWRLKSRAGRPAIPAELQALIRRMAGDNPLWGAERIANELWLKLGLRVSPRSVAKYRPRRAPGRPRGELPGSLCLRGDRAWRPPAPACERHRASDGGLDESIRGLGVRVLKSPPRSPQANGICERINGTIRRECLDWLIPVSEAHLRAILREWVAHYNRSRPHMALGHGIPDPPMPALRPATSASRHRLSKHMTVLAEAVPGGLHHDHSLAEAAG